MGVDEIAARTHLTKRTLYTRFRSKDYLLAAMLARYSELDRQKAAGDRSTATGRGSGDDQVSFLPNGRMGQQAALVRFRIYMPRHRTC